LEALSLVSGVLPEVTLSLVGDGPERQRLQARIDELDLAHHAILEGTVDHVQDRLRKASILWMLSPSEGLPMAALEAMAVGTPVVGYDVAGTRDAVVNGRTGFLVPYGRIDEVARRTVALLQDERLFRRCSEECVRWVRHSFSLEKMLQGHERVIARLLEGATDSLPSRQRGG
jgi:glycosyltransferase involved in cell wall biosynthesis